LAPWLPFVTVASIVFAGLAVVAFIWRTVPGRVERAPHSDERDPRPVHVAAPGAAQALPPEPVAVSGDVQ
jgi:hypothetical protein